MALPRGAATADRVLAAQVLSDEDPRSAWPRCWRSGDAGLFGRGAAFVTAVLRGSFEDDRWLTHAATAAAAAQSERFLELLAELCIDGPASETAPSSPGGWPSTSPVKVTSTRSVASWSRSRGPGRSSASGWPDRWSPAVRAAGRRQTDREADPASEEAVVKLVGHLPSSAKGRLAKLAGQWGVKGMEESIAAIASASRPSSAMRPSSASTLTLQHGIGADAPKVIAMYAAVVRGLTQDSELAFAFSTLAMDLDRKLYGRVSSPVSFLHSWFVNHWIRPMRTNPAIAWEGRASA